MTRKKTIHAIFLPLLLILLTSACGKITQVTKKDEDEKAFKATFLLSVVPTENTKVTLASTSPGGVFTVEDTPLYLQLQGIALDGNKNELSWGKAELTTILEDGVQTENEKKRNIKPKPQPKIFSTAYRKDGIKFSKENYLWGLMNFTQKTSTWQGNMAQIPQNYPLFLLTVYNDQGKFTMRLFADTDVPKKGDLAIGAITAYDSFIATLFLMDLQESKAGLKDAFSIADLSSIFTADVFNSLNYSPVTNSVKQFRVKSPVFILKGPLETSLLDFMDLVKTHDKTETEIFLTKLKRRKIISEKTEALLKKNADLFKKEAS